MATVSNGEAKKGAAAAACDDVESTTESATGCFFSANFAETVACLPQETRFPPFPSLRLYRGFWIPEVVLTGLPEVHARFEPTRTDVLLASFPKSGTTWLKSLGFAVVRRSAHPPSDAAHPLLHGNPHDCVKFIDRLRALENDDGLSPRVLATHLPYSLLPERTKVHGSAGCREPKDTLVSWWHFKAAETDDISFEEAFELYCQGRCGVGPQWKHVLEYWEASKRSPASVLFLGYESMLQDPEGNLKRMAEFMGCPFSRAEEEAGMVSAILDLCSLEKQRGLEVNKSGDQSVKGVLKVDNKSFFRKGVVGDWRNHMTPEMATKLDTIVEEALRGSGFTFGVQHTE